MNEILLASLAGAIIGTIWSLSEYFIKYLAERKKEK